MRHSSENSSLASYGHIISYASTGNDAPEAMGKLDESLHLQQPKNEVENEIDEAN